MQAPKIFWKHPPVKAIPLLNVDVAPEERKIEPPVIESPAELASPAVLTPPANVEVAVPEALISWVTRRFPTLTLFAKVEDPCAEMFCASKVEEA